MPTGFSEEMAKPSDGSTSLNQFYALLYTWLYLNSLPYSVLHLFFFNDYTFFWTSLRHYPRVSSRPLSLLLSLFFSYPVLQSYYYYIFIQLNLVAITSSCFSFYSQVPWPHPQYLCARVLPFGNLGAGQGVNAVSFATSAFSDLHRPAV